MKTLILVEGWLGRTSEEAASDQYYAVRYEEYTSLSELRRKGGRGSEHSQLATEVPRSETVSSWTRRDRNQQQGSVPADPRCHNPVPKLATLWAGFQLIAEW